MKQYLELGKKILAEGRIRGDRTGTGTISLFGAQVRFNLQEGFPLLTTKKMFLKGIVHELLWFLKGSTNNNELTSQGVNIWTPWQTEDGQLGKIYGKQWRAWEGKVLGLVNSGPFSSDGEKMYFKGEAIRKTHDQISELIENLKKRPFSRRHVISAWNVEDLPDESISPQENVKNGKMALAPCHCLFQFYVREMTAQERYSYMFNTKTRSELPDEELHSVCNEEGVPKYFLDCQLYQR